MVVVVKTTPANAGDARDLGLIPGVRKIPWSRKWQLTPVFLPGKFYGQRSLMGNSLFDHRVGHACTHLQFRSLMKVLFRNMRFLSMTTFT